MLERDLLNDFLHSHEKKRWVYGENAAIFVRRSRRLLPSGKGALCFDLANITVRLPGTGIFTKLLANMQSLAAEHGLDAVYIENVLNKRLAEHLRKMGYAETADGGSFFVFPPTESKHVRT